MKFGLGLLLAFSLCAQVPEAALQLAQPGAKVLIGIDLKGLRESAAGKAMRSQLETQMPDMRQLGPAAMFVPMAFQLVNDIDYILVSSPGGPAGTTAAAKAAAQNPPFLLVVKGRIQNTLLAFAMTGAHERYGSVDIYQAPSTKTPTAFASLNAETIVLGDPASVRGAIDLHTGVGQGKVSTVSAALLARANEMAATHDIWFVAPDSLSNIAPQSSGFANGPGAQIEGFEMGIGLRTGMQFDLNVTTKTEQAAAQFSSLLAMGIASQSQRGDPRAEELLRKLNFSTEGKRLRVNLSLSQAELEEYMRYAQTQRGLAGVTPNPSQGQAAQAQVAPPAKPGKIRIVGLDDGPREIDVR